MCHNLDATGLCAVMGDRCIFDGGRDIRGCAYTTITDLSCPDCLLSGRQHTVYRHTLGDAHFCSNCRSMWDGLEELCNDFAGRALEMRNDRDAVAAQRDEARGMVPPVAGKAAEVVRQ